MRKGSHASEELRRKLSEAHKGKIQSEETRKKKANAQQKNCLNPEYLKKLSESHKGKPSGMLGKHHSEETKRKISESNMGRIGALLGKYHSEETKQKLRDSNSGENNGMFGRTQSEETRIKISLAIKNPSKETRQKMSDSAKRKPPISKETRKKMSDSQHGRKHSEETRKKMSIARRLIVVPINDTSIELKLQAILTELGIGFIKHHYMKEIEHGYQADIFIPSSNLVLEADGDYWHGPRFPERVERDKIRTQELKEKGFKVLRLWEHEIKQMTREQLAERIEKLRGQNDS